MDLSDQTDGFFGHMQLLSRVPAPWAFSRRVVRCKLLIALKDVKIPDMMAITWKNACITKLFEKVLHLHNSIQYWNNENTINETNTYFGFTMLCFSSFTTVVGWFEDNLDWKVDHLNSADDRDHKITLHTSNFVFWRWFISYWVST